MIDPATSVDRVVFTIGHSTRPIDEFVALLQGHGVTTLVDVRTVPKSRHNPQFNRDALGDALPAAGIAYQYDADLGGFRSTRAGSPNMAWRNLSFRGYADYMQTPEFAEHVDRLVALAQCERPAIMCAEAVPWRCHRSLIADALVVRGVRVEDIIGAAAPRPHALTRFAHVEGTRITNP